MAVMRGLTIIVFLTICFIFISNSVSAERNLSGAYVVTELRDEESALLFPSDLSRITATFNEMKVSGSAGCNVYSATYNETGDKLTISAPISTLMYCDPGVMESEAQYLKNLEKVTHYKIIGNHLFLFDVGNHPVISLTKPKEEIIIPFPYDTPYILMKIQKDNRYTYAFLAIKTIIEFHPDGSITGNGGCNELNGTYNLTESEITFGPITKTKKACNKSRINQEQMVMDVLKGTVLYEIIGDTLFFKDAAGKPLAEWKVYQSD